MTNRDDIPGVVYRFHALPAVASSGNTAIEAVCPNPFESRSGYVNSIHLIPIENITGDDTNSQNYNAQLVAGTEIANLDYPAAHSGTKGVADAFTMSGTTAQRTIASGGSILIQREEVGTQPVRLTGSVIRVGWKAV